MSGGIFNNRLLLLFSLLFSGNFVGEQGLDGGGQSRDPPSPPTRENPGCLRTDTISQFDVRISHV